MTQSLKINVVVQGAAGKMGSEVLNALCHASDMEPTGAVSRNVTEEFLPLPDGSGLVPLSSNLDHILNKTKSNVVVDFTDSNGALEAARFCANRGVHLVTGSTGLDQQALTEIENLANGNHIGVLIAPNFALGAILLTHLARIASQHFEYIEISEAHHEGKLDSPSGTALSLAQAISESRKTQINRPMPSRETLQGTRGGDYDGVSIHSSRMPGRMAHHEVTFGSPGQTLLLRHDTINRSCYMPGVLLGVRYVTEHPGLTIGLEKVLNL